MRFMFYRPDRSPVEIDGFVRHYNGEVALRPVPRIGERVIIDGDYCIVKDVTHLVQIHQEVRIFIEASQP